MDHTFPSLPPTQAQSSPTFRLPPLDGSLTIFEIYDWHMRNTPNHPLFLYRDIDGLNKSILWPDAVKAIHRAAKHFRLALGYTVDSPPASGPETPIVAILAAAGAFTCIMHITLYPLTNISYNRHNNVLHGACWIAVCWLRSVSHLS